MVSQKPEAKRKNTASNSSQADGVDENAKVTAEANAKMKPKTLMILGVKPSLWAILASVVSISWICFFSFVSKYCLLGFLMVV
jgi:hypothetical protein